MGAGECMKEKVEVLDDEKMMTSKVYEASHVKTGESVAIKVMERKKIQRDGMANQILREVTIMKMVSHPYIVDLYEVMASKTKIYFVMEYIKGGNLCDKVESQTLSEKTVRKYFQQLISVVDFCHSKGVYHRDIKLENLLVDEKGDLKVTDFGLSAMAEHKGTDGLFHAQCGSLSYVPPEVFEGRRYDGCKVDIWSCGGVLFVLMAGDFPFHKHFHGFNMLEDNLSSVKWPTHMSEEVRELLSNIFVTDPERRFSITQIMQNRS